MAQIAKISSKIEIKSPSEKMYDFFKNNFTQLSHVDPYVVKRVELIEGKEGQVGNVKFCEYVLGKAMTAKLKTTKIDDEERSLTIEAVEGEVLQMFPGIKATMTTSEGCIEWTFEHEKGNESAPSADPYAKLVVQITKALDAYFLTN